jgi:hypothetical protein
VGAEAKISYLKQVQFSRELHLPASAGDKAPVVRWIYADSTNLAGFIDL